MSASRPGTGIDVVIVSYNSGDTLRASVAPLAALDHVSVIVVDNASPERSLEVIADLPVRAIDSGHNGGFSFGCNIGVAAGDAPYVLFLNPDAQIGEDALWRLAGVLDAEPGVGIVGPRILEGDGSLFPSMRRYQRPGSVWATALFLHRVLRRAPWANEIIKSPDLYDHVAHPEWISGACFMARRSVMEQIGGFDEGFFLYNEDMDLCARVRASGLDVRYEPSATARHEGGRSAPRTGLYAVLVRSRIRFARRQSGPVSAWLQRLGLAVGAATHVVVNVRRPAHRRGHAAALRAIVGGPGQPTGVALRGGEAT
jgi:N-acetylglucosaminyl-diphospho-decaprenol L-rhamnosyltransferase